MASVHAEISLGADISDLQKAFTQVPKAAAAAGAQTGDAFADSFLKEFYQDLARVSGRTEQQMRKLFGPQAQAAKGAGHFFDYFYQDMARVTGKTEQEMRKVFSPQSQAAKGAGQFFDYFYQDMARVTGQTEKEMRKLFSPQAKDKKTKTKDSGRDDSKTPPRTHGTAFGGGQNLGYRVGFVAMQAQDIAIQAQMGTKWATIMAQQGSQLLSVFGPKGIILGGVVAIGAAIYNWATGVKEAEKAAEQFEKNLAGTREASQIHGAALVKETELSKGSDAAKEVELKLRNREQLLGIDQTLDEKTKRNMERAMVRDFKAEKALLDRDKERRESEETKRAQNEELKGYLGLTMPGEGTIMGIRDAINEIEQKKVKAYEQIELQKAKVEEAGKIENADLRQSELEKSQAELKKREVEPERLNRIATILKNRQIDRELLGGSELNLAQVVRVGEEALEAKKYQQMSAEEKRKKRMDERAQMNADTTNALQLRDKDLRKGINKQLEKEDAEARRKGGKVLTPEERKKELEKRLRAGMNLEANKEKLTLAKETIDELAKVFAKENANLLAK